MSLAWFVGGRLPFATIAPVQKDSRNDSVTITPVQKDSRNGSVTITPACKYCTFRPAYLWQVPAWLLQQRCRTWCRISSDAGRGVCRARRCTSFLCHVFVVVVVVVVGCICCRCCGLAVTLKASSPWSLRGDGALVRPENHNKRTIGVRKRLSSSIRNTIGQFEQNIIIITGEHKQES